MPSAKCNSTMQRAMGLISSLLDVTLSKDVPFANHISYIACIMVLSLSSSESCFFRHYHFSVNLNMIL